MTTAVHPYIEALLRGGEMSHSPYAWLNERRAHALERANALAVPTTRDEEWRFTDITPLTRTSFNNALPGATPDRAALEKLLLPEATARLVFIDGYFAPEYSVTIRAAVTVESLLAALQRPAEGTEQVLARLASVDSRVFVALNTAHLRDGAYVHAARNAEGGVVQVLFVSTTPDTVSYPRSLIQVEQGAQCTVIEEYVSLGDGASFANAVTEIAVAPNARVRHVRLQRQNLASYHIAQCAVSIAKDASYCSQSITFGARISRYDLEVVQRGEGAEAVIDGLALISGRQLADTHTTMDHACPHGRSQQLHKTIAGGGAHAVFNGKVIVRPGAQLIDSAQESRNLLLSDKARVDTKPQLEIFADDVKCSHGATVGQLDPDHLFYLKSRGLPDALARRLLTYAFGAQVIERIPVASVVRELERVVLEQTGA
ncbi:MAG: Fe-S cluster assembly protein SufD [Rhodospirillaceae bacterium]